MLPKNLYRLALFDGLDHDSIDLIAPLMEARTYPDKAIVYRQNQDAKDFYVLLSGEIVVKHKPYDGDEITIARVSPEDVIGWSAALGRPRYTSTAYTVLPCEVLKIDVGSMREFCQTNPQIGQKILEKLAMGIAFRLKSTYDDVLALITHGMHVNS